MYQAYCRESKPYLPQHEKHSEEAESELAEENRTASKWSVQEYLEQHQEDRALIIGCGRSPEKVKMDNLDGIPCSLGQRHEHDFTVDISPDANADLTMDFVLYSGSDLFGHGEKQFDVVSFEYLNRGPRRPFGDTHVELWISAANKLLRNNGKIIFYSGSDSYINAATNAMKRLGYKVQEKIVEADGSPGNRYGHKYCEGIKPRSWFW